MRLPQMGLFADEPFADTSLMPTFELSAFTRRSTTVALSGDGGDELFAGYPTYRANALRAKARYLPGFMLSAARNLYSLVPADHGKVSLNYKVRQFLEYCDLSFERAHYSWRKT